jgi:V/A-type H+-transporting ATPase subunit I
LDRQRAILPMLIFSLSVGVVHVGFGQLLGCLGALRRGEPRQAWGKAVSILVILCLAALGVSRLVPLSQPVSRALGITLVCSIPLMLLTGGLLAPLELLKDIGNIISYARIMAIGLASVLIAYLANRFAGLCGDLVLGALAAGLLHLVNLLLGIFSPTIHALRLHYVEFFGKFMRYGGRRFEPYHRAPKVPPLKGAREVTHR